MSPSSLISLLEEGEELLSIQWVQIVCAGVGILSLGLGGVVWHVPANAHWRRERVLRSRGSFGRVLRVEVESEMRTRMSI